MTATNGYLLACADCVLYLSFTGECLALEHNKETDICKYVFAVLKAMKENRLLHILWSVIGYEEHWTNYCSTHFFMCP